MVGRGCYAETRWFTGAEPSAALILFRSFLLTDTLSVMAKVAGLEVRHWGTLQPCPLSGAWAGLRWLAFEKTDHSLLRAVSPMSLQLSRCSSLGHDSHGVAAWEKTKVIGPRRPLLLLLRISPCTGVSGDLFRDFSLILVQIADSAFVLLQSKMYGSYPVLSLCACAMSLHKITLINRHNFLPRPGRPRVRFPRVRTVEREELYRVVTYGTKRK